MAALVKKRERQHIDGRALVRLLVPGLLVAVLATEWVILLTRSFATGMGQDFTSFYVAALAWLHGYNPYTSNAAAHLAASLHVRDQGDTDLPLLLPAIAPFTLLAPRAAFALYVLTQDALIAAGALLLGAACGVRRRRLLVLACVASPPAFLVGYMGQIGALVYVCAAIAWWARRTGRPVLLGLCVVAACIKPQLGLCAALSLLWGAPRQAWLGALAGCALFVGGMVLVVGPAGCVDYLHVLHDFSGSSVLRGNTDGLGISALYEAWLPPALSSALTHAFMVALGLAIVALLARYRARPSTPAVALMTPLVALLLPYSHQYDSIALLPALVVGGQHLSRRGTARLLWFVAAALVIVTPLLALSAVPVPFRLLPLGLMVWVASATSIVRPAPGCYTDVAA